jgi:hypothetical protein
MRRTRAELPKSFPKISIQPFYLPREEGAIADCEQNKTAPHSPNTGKALLDAISTKTPDIAGCF